MYVCMYVCMYVLYCLPWRITNNNYILPSLWQSYKSRVIPHYSFKQRQLSGGAAGHVSATLNEGMHCIVTPTFLKFCRKTHTQWHILITILTAYVYFQHVYVYISVDIGLGLSSFVHCWIFDTDTASSKKKHHYQYHQFGNFWFFLQTSKEIWSHITP